MDNSIVDFSKLTFAEKETLFDLATRVNLPIPGLTSQFSKPNYGDIYYYITSSGRVDSYTWDDDDMDFRHFSFGNVFACEAEAQAAITQHKKLHLIRQHAAASGIPLNWTNRHQPKYRVEYDYFRGRYISVSCHSNAEIVGAIYFTRREDAEAAIEALTQAVGP